MVAVANLRRGPRHPGGAVTPEEIRDHAKRIVSLYLEDGIEYCFVYEDEALEGVGCNNWEAIHDAANRLIEGIVL